MRKRVDDNQKKIVFALRESGVSVQHLHEVGNGCPDLLCGYDGVNYLIEVQDGKKYKSQQQLTADQKKWHYDWQGQVEVISSVEEALQFVSDIING